MKETKYKQTEVGMIPSDWEVKTIKDLGVFLGGGTPSTKNESFWKGNIPWISSADLNDDDIEHISTTRFITQEAVNCSATQICPQGTILIIARVGVGKLALSQQKVCTSQDFCNLIPSKENDSKFLAYALLPVMKQMANESQGTSIKGVAVDEIKKVQIIVPSSKAEQTAIANALSDVDTLIANLEKLIAKKKNIKQGAMQQLLTGRVRLPGFGTDNGHTDWFTPNGVHEKTIKTAKVVRPESIRVKDKEQCTGYKMTELGMIPTDWEVKNVGSLLKIGHGRDYKKLKEGAVPVFGTGGYMTSVNQYLYDGETVCIGRKGTIDKPFYHEGKIWTVDTLFYTYDFENCIPKYIYYSFCLVDWLSMNEASGIPSLTSKNIEDVMLRIPSKEEQTAIANVLSSIDKEIETLNTKLEKYRSLKTGMMQQLLTGKIRLV